MQQTDLHQALYPADGAHGVLTPGTTREERAFLDRQRYRLELARDALVRELANQGSFHRLRPAGTATPSAGSGTCVVGGLEAMLERKLGLRLGRVVRALKKIEEGTYGLCEVTGRPIARARLEQVPEEIETPEGRRILRLSGPARDGR